MMRQTMKPTFRSAARLALALSLVGFGTMAATAGGKSPPTAYDVTLENISYDLYGLKLSYPKIDIKGANIPKAEIEKMLAADTPQADRLKALKGFTANSVDIPATNLSFERGTVKASLACTGEKMEKITDGKIGKYSLTGCTGQAERDGKSLANLNLGIKSGATNNYNFVHIYRLWTEKAGPEDKDAVALSSGGTFEGVTYSFTAPTMNMQGEYGKLTETEAAKVKLLSRPLKDAVEQVAGLVANMAKDPSAKRPSAQEVEQIKQAGLLAIEFFENTQLGSSTVENYSFTQTVHEPKMESPMTIGAKVGKMETTGFNQKASDISFNGGKVTGKLGSFTINGFSLAPFAAEAKKLLSLPTEQFIALFPAPKKAEDEALPEPFKERPDTAKLEALIKRLGLSVYANLGTFTARDLEVNAVGIDKSATLAIDDEDESDDAEAPQAPATPEMVDVKITLKDFTFRLEKPVNAIPSSFRLSYDNLNFPTFVLGLSGKASDVKLAEQLKASGYNNLDLSHAIDLTWNKDTNELAVNEISAGETATGSALLKGTIGNFTESMFTIDTTAMALTALGLTVKDASLQVDDKGGFDRLLKLAAEEKGATPEQLKAMVPLMAEMIPEPFASMSSVKTLKSALLKFWQNPGKLDITVKAKNGTGLGFADFMAASQDPASIDAKIEVDATATK